MHRKFAPGLDFLSGGGEMGALMRAHDWSTSPLGRPEDWPQSLRTVVSLMLTSKFPMFVAWGPRLAFLYNDGYRPIFGAKHPHALGLPFVDVWSEIWSDIEPLVTKALAGEATYHEDMHLVMERNGYPEDTWYTFSYSPVRDETGGIGGMFCACTETTQEVKSRASLKAEQDRLRELFRQAPGFMAMLSGRDHVFELANDAYLQLVGHRRDILGKTVRDVLPEIEGQGFFELLDKVYATGEPFVGRSLRVRLQREPGSSVEDRFVDLVYQPITDRTGDVTGIFAEGYDVTERVQAEESLRESEARFRNLADNAPVMIWVTEPDGSSSYLSRSWYEFTGQTPETGLGFGWLDAVHPEDRDWSGKVFLEANAKREAFRLEYRLRRVDGTYRWAIDAAAPRFGEDGAFLGYVGSVLDITDRKRIEEHRELLINELNHRVKNTLAIVQSMAAQSLRQLDDESRHKFQAFEDRLFALARAHDVLTRENWEGAELREIIDEVVEPYLRQKTKHFEIEGEHLRLIPRTALAIAMAIHELATNAAKYGALSVPSGCVVITWTLAPGAEPRLVLRWQEKGGPPVTAPTRRGFGTRLIERSLSTDVGGDVQLTYAPTGVVCEMDIPLIDATDAQERASSH
ncbi:PAS domain-containing sensor histidine kinase [Microvirga lotononidis]|uniref:Blue-light-activated histidine kinase n=1 Tax=Microvirga lotononidis TaxID=864069 RepID=I4YYN1_9HYPH|nr:PAS domain S-box protein [Microvirga lotononidis]EIM29073.1 PAS domain S-box [Microvirga lotononidis]WQO28917.1 PAS domain S-box protein [Microvirga lotononidis]